MSDTRTSLTDAYRAWTRSRRALAAAVEALTDPRARSGIDVALENALMRQTLEQPGAGPDALFAALDVDGIAAGFRFAGVTGDEAREAASVALSALRAARQRPAPAPSEELHITLDRNEVRVGAFRLRRNAPVDRVLQVAIGEHGPTDGLRHTLTSALRYATIYARTRHIGPPQRVYDDFHRWGVRNEGFASPFNSRLIGYPDSGFCSAFADTDGPLGSRGSFFEVDPDAFPGAWCLDPPFLPETMRRVDAIIRRWRDRSDPVSVLLVVPMSHTPDLAIDETVVLEAGIHHYEGLDGELHPLPVDVGVHRVGDLPGFDGEAIRDGYLPRERPSGTPLASA